VQAVVEAEPMDLDQVAVEDLAVVEMAMAVKTPQAVAAP
jgi:hypothetical protein